MRTKAIIRLTLLSFLLLSACSNLVVGTQKPEASAAPAAQTAAAEFYIAPTSIDLTRILPPPPAPDSAGQKADIAAVLGAQKARTKAQADQVQADAKSSIYRFSDVLGPNFTEEKLPVTTAFFKKVQKNLSAIADISKECFARPRPFVADSHVHPPGNITDAIKNDPKREQAAIALLPADAADRCTKIETPPDYSFSYPSGHSTFGTMTAIILSNMVPEKRAALYKRGWDYGQQRVVAGVHYPSDVEAGRIQASVVVAELMQNPQFQSDFAAAKTELRGVLGLAN